VIFLKKKNPYYWLVDKTVCPLGLITKRGV